MYRTTKRKLVRRASTASAVALFAIAGLGVTVIAQSGALTSALKTGKTAVTTKSSTKVTTTTPKYHIVSSRFHDDSNQSRDN